MALAEEKKPAVWLLIGTIVSLLSLHVLASSTHNEWISKVTPELQLQLLSKSTVDISIALAGGSNILSVLNLASVNRRSNAQIIRDFLQTSNRKIQANVLSTLKAHREIASVKTFWITSQVYVEKASLAAVENLVGLDEVAKIDVHQKIRLEDFYLKDKTGSIQLSLAKEEMPTHWGIEKMRVPEVREAPWGTNGSGITVGIIDTGVRGTHEAIRDNYKNDGFSWRDPHNQYDVPTDMYNHGTHVAGTILGRKQNIGIAPEAKWIACKGYTDQGSGTEAGFIECCEFLVCPTDKDGKNPDCSKTVDVASNSWGSVGNPLAFDDVLRVWHLVGITPIFAAGNWGTRGCQSSYMPSDSPLAIGVGATGQLDELAYFSGRGPSVRGVGLHKPDISAPGIGIYSADARSDEAYSVKSGTSMSCPHVVGVAVLMKGVKRDGSVDEFKHILEETAVRDTVKTSGEVCDGIRDDEWPNNHFGHGRVDAYEAVKALLNHQ